MTNKPTTKYIMNVPATPNEFLPRPFLAVLFSLSAGKDKIVFDSGELNNIIEYYCFSEILLFEEHQTRKDLILYYWTSKQELKVIQQFLNRYLTKYRNNKLEYLEFKSKTEIKDPINALSLKESIKKTRLILRDWKKTYGPTIRVDFFKLENIPPEVRFFEALWSLQQRKEIILQDNGVHLTGKFVSRPPVEYKGLRISGHKVIYKDIEIEMDPKSHELALIKLLITKEGKAVTREHIFKHLNFSPKSNKAAKNRRSSKQSAPQRYADRLANTIKRIYKKFEDSGIHLKIMNTKVKGVFIIKAEFRANPLND